MRDARHWIKRNTRHDPWEYLRRHKCPSAAIKRVSFGVGVSRGAKELTALIKYPIPPPVKIARRMAPLKYMPRSTDGKEEKGQLQIAKLRRNSLGSLRMSAGKNGEGQRCARAQRGARSTYS